MTIPLPKLEAILLYFCHNTDRKFLGKVKLMKLFYFLDFMHIKKYGVPVTYDRYVKLEHGPIPTTIKNLVDTAADDIDNSELADTIAFERPEGIDMYRVVPRRDLTKRDIKLFSEIELETLRAVCTRFANVNTGDIKKASHKESPWRDTNLLDRISYTLAANDPDCSVSKEEIELLSQLIEK